jgi:hypothetical protein
MLVLAVLYVPSFGPAMFFYRRFEENDAYVKTVGIVYEPLLAYMRDHPDAWLFDYMHWWSELGAAGDRADGVITAKLPSSVRCVPQSSNRQGPLQGGRRSAASAEHPSLSRKW